MLPVRCFTGYWGKKLKIISRFSCANFTLLISTSLIIWQCLGNISWECWGNVNMMYPCPLGWLVLVSVPQLLVLLCVSARHLLFVWCSLSSVCQMIHHNTVRKRNCLTKMLRIWLCFYDANFTKMSIQNIAKKCLWPLDARQIDINLK